MKNQPSFNESCYQLLRKVPRGKVTTYQELARALGTKAYRAVGNAMHRNPYAPKVPCHRVVRSNGEMGGYAGGIPKKIRMLTDEGIELKNGVVKDLNRFMFRFR